MTTSIADPIDVVARLLAAARRVVCLTGAGVSAESGVATFRDAQTGLWSTFDPQLLASQDGFVADPGLVWRWYMHRLAQVEQAVPNPGHQALAEIEAMKPAFTLVTQNVDDLHERAGSRHVLHLHGRIDRFHCNRCSVSHDLRVPELAAPRPPRCLSCGGPVRPSVVWFGEALPGRILDRAWLETEHCDLMLVVGTSGVVYPAAQLPFLAQHHKATVIDINPDASAISVIADYHLQGPSGIILPALVEAMRRVE